MAVRVIYDMSEDSKLREIARLREKALHDEASALKNAKEEGREEGRAEGREEGRAEERAAAKEREKYAILQLKAIGLTDEQIKKVYPDTE